MLHNVSQDNSGVEYNIVAKTINYSEARKKHRNLKKETNLTQKQFCNSFLAKLHCHSNTRAQALKVR